MAQSGNPRPPGLARVVAAVPQEDVVVRRPPRREVTGIAYNMQRTSLALDETEDGPAQRHRCQIVNTSDGGLCVTLRLPGGLQAYFSPGMRLSLEPAHEKPVRVEVRWVRADRMGLRRLRPDEFQGQPIPRVAGSAPGAAPAAGLRPRKRRWPLTLKGRLILDRPDSMGVKAHSCRVVNTSDDGFCVAIDVSYPLPELCEGARLALEQNNGRRARMEVRWFKEGRVGLRTVQPLGR